MIRLRALLLIRKYAKEYLKEFKQADLGEADEGFYTFVSDRHYFNFELVRGKLRLLSITEIVYF